MAFARFGKSAALLPAASRALAAVLGGYVLTLAFAAALATALQHGERWSRGEAMVSAAMAAFVVYLLAALRAFVAPSARRAWAELLAVAALLAVLAAAWR
jgi:hypothetical protein